MKLLVEAYRAQFELFFRFGKILEREEYRLAISPRDSKWFWGSFIVFKNAPQKNDAEVWEKIWNEEFKNYPEILHKSFCWNSVNGEEGECGEFIQKGYSIYNSLTLACTNPPSAIKFPEGISFSKIQSNEDWQKVIALQQKVDEEKYEGGIGDYKRTQIENFRLLSEEGKGDWYGAFAGKTLVGDMGLFDGGNETGLIVFVETHPQFRGKGICAGLTQFVLQQAFQTFYKKVILVAMKDHESLSVYKRCGFEIIERTTELCLPA